ncbi:enoyl-CoA hydratase/isomerase family protein [Granulicoccus phenolivorans]|uniref:enoyl-CoA hydratase/isomerase family protein n=1 Tax=Granulicoccus phenolivorans TaxID=266854 RepID=UPI0003FA85C7|nr:enoyl-CoA hydratase-related protein [Granulicoccus phenolivorans]
MSVIRTTGHDGWIHVELSSPANRNALGTQFVEALIATAEHLHREMPRAVLVTAEGPTFTVGGDLKLFAGLSAEELPATMDWMVSGYHGALLRWLELPMPVVAAVHGAVAGGGLGLLGVADTVLAAEGTVFASGFAALGLSGDGLWSWFLPRMIGQRRTVEFVFEQRNLEAAEAADWGLVTRVVPGADLLAEGTRVVQRYAAGPSGSLARMKDLLVGPTREALRQQAARETAAMHDTVRSPDAVTGIRAFVAKQQPRFQGS